MHVPAAAREHALNARYVYEPMRPQHVEELESILRNDAVYRYIGGVPTPEKFRLGLQRSMQGPPAERVDERWINFVVRDGEGGPLLGHLQATLHGGFAEVAFLFDPAQWGKGHATAGLRWLQAYLVAEHGVGAFWATTVPANTGSRALLQRSGYVARDPATAPRLYSYDDGDLVFFRPAP